jgi:hypothetical protein
MGHGPCVGLCHLSAGQQFVHSISSQTSPTEITHAFQTQSACMFHGITCEACHEDTTKRLIRATLQAWMFDEFFVSPQDTPDLGGHPR